MKQNTILVPTDFTEAADVASKHAVLLAKIFNGKIIFLHIIGKDSGHSDAKAKMNQFIDNFKRESSIACDGVIKTGNIFDDIGEVASELSAKFIVMGTHGVKGMQHITGSKALKVITNSKIPFIVVQNKTTTKNGYDNIVLPLDLTKETKQKIGYCTEIAKNFNSTIHLIVPKTNDKDLLTQVKRNVTFAKKYLAENKIKSTIKVAEGNSFSKEVLKFAEELNSDLIAIMNAGENFLFGIGTGSKQSILTNEKMIPVLCVNPVDTSISFWK